MFFDICLKKIHLDHKIKITLFTEEANYRFLSENVMSCSCMHASFDCSENILMSLMKQ